MSAPKPYTPSDCDLRDYPGMIVGIRRLLKSETWIQGARTPFLSHAVMTLWAEAFHQVPAGSLPDKGPVIEHLSMLDAKAWKKVAPLAMDGWTLCTDGRLYHRVVAEVALEAWIDKLMRRLQSGSGHAARYGQTFDPADTIVQLEVAGAHLAAIDPRSKALERIRKRRTPSDKRPSKIRSASERNANADRTDVRTEAPTDVRTDVRTQVRTASVRDAKRMPDACQVEVQVEGEEEEEEDSSLRSESADTGLRAGEAGLLDKVGARLREAAGQAIDDPACAPALIDLSPILNLMAYGQGPPCDLEADILPTIRRLCAKRKARSIRSWSFFTTAIAEARDRRLQGAPAQVEILPHERPDHPHRNLDRDDRLGSMLRGAVAASEG